MPTRLHQHQRPQPRPHQTPDLRLQVGAISPDVRASCARSSAMSARSRRSGTWPSVARCQRRPVFTRHRQPASALQARPSGSAAEPGASRPCSGAPRPPIALAAQQPCLHHFHDADQPHAGEDPDGVILAGVRRCRSHSGGGYRFTDQSISDVRPESSERPTASPKASPNNWDTHPTTPRATTFQPVGRTK